MRSNRLDADEGGVPPNKVVHRTREHVAFFRAASLHVLRGKRLARDRAPGNVAGGRHLNCAIALLCTAWNGMVGVEGLVAGLDSLQGTPS